jgi:hypothetical protein
MRALASSERRELPRRGRGAPLSADLAGLETDERVLLAIECLGTEKLNYGFFRGHVYIAVQTSYITIDRARRSVANCGGELATISDAEENAFVFSLIQHDRWFFSTTPEPDNGHFYSKGPMFGLVQPHDAREPDGGWYWLSGEPLTFTNWRRSNPDEDFPNQELVAFGNELFDDPRKRVPFGFRDSEATWEDLFSGYGYIIEIE